MSKTNFSSFVHLSDATAENPLAEIAKVPQNNYKPRGLYFSPLEGKTTMWWEWCKREGFFPSDYRTAYKLKNPSELKILRVTKWKEEQEFFKKYSGNEAKPIDWKKISEEYDGFFITQKMIDRPLWNKHMKRTPVPIIWESFDVESLVVWRPGVVLEPVDTPFLD